MVDGWKRSWKKLPSLKGWRARCGFILQLAPTVRLAMPRGRTCRRVDWAPWSPKMLSFSGSLKIFVLVEPCDMRKGFNGLYGMVTTSFGEDPRSGALFVFSNRRHTRIKILYWDGSGLWVLTKRLERGSFSWPPVIAGESAKLKLTPEAFAMLTDGVDLRGAKLRPWYERQ